MISLLVASLYFMAEFVKKSVDAFLDEMLDTRFWILDFNRMLSLFYPAWSIQ